MTPKSTKDLEKMGALGSPPSCSSSWSPARRLSPGHSNTKHYLGIQVTLTEELGTVSPPPHAWMVSLVEDMLYYSRTGLTEALVTSPGRAIIFYGRCSMGEGLSLGKVRDTAFVLMGAGTWVGKPACLTMDPLIFRKVNVQLPSHNRPLGKGNRPGTHA